MNHSGKSQASMCQGDGIYLRDDPLLATGEVNQPLMRCEVWEWGGEAGVEQQSY